MIKFYFFFRGGRVGEKPKEEKPKVEEPKEESKTSKRKKKGKDVEESQKNQKKKAKKSGREGGPSWVLFIFSLGGEILPWARAAQKNVPDIFFNFYFILFYF